MSAATRPLYVQIADLLVRDIAAGRLAEGDRLAPERDMARDMGIAVGTLRKALKRLEGQGLLERRQGSGNYIADTRAAGGLYGFFRLEKVGGGGQPTAEVLSVGRAVCPFGTLGAEAHRIRRLRRIGGVAAALEDIWLDLSVAPELPQDLPGALYRYYADAFQLYIAEVDDRVGLARAPAWAPAAFGAGPGAAVGHVLRRAQDGQGRCREISETWFDPSKVCYANRIR